SLPGAPESKPVSTRTGSVIAPKARAAPVSMSRREEEGFGGMANIISLSGNPAQNASGAAGLLQPAHVRPPGGFALILVTVEWRREGAAGRDRNSCRRRGIWTGNVFGVRRPGRSNRKRDSRWPDTRRGARGGARRKNRA